MDFACENFCSISRKVTIHNPTRARIVWILKLVTLKPLLNHHFPYTIALLSNTHRIVKSGSFDFSQVETFQLTAFSRCLSEHTAPQCSCQSSMFVCIYIYFLFINIYIYVPDWWFQTCFIFHNIWDNPSHWLSYFSRWLKPPTRYIAIKGDCSSINCAVSFLWCEAPVIFLSTIINPID